MSRVDADADRDMEESHKLKIIFMDREQKSKLKCVWCGKEQDIFGWMRIPEDNKDGVACESCIKANF